jgi:hypothetical protein
MLWIASSFDARRAVTGLATYSPSDSMFSLTRMATQWALAQQYAAIELPTTTQPLSSFSVTKQQQ